MFINHQGIKNPTVTLEGITGQKTLNLSLCGFISKHLTFMGNNPIPKSYYLLLQSMLKVFSLFNLQAQFDGDEMSEVWIQCTCCNKKSLSGETNITCFIKTVVLHHVGLSWMIVMK